MSGDPRLSELLLRWEELGKQGVVAPLEDLCRDCPELLEPLRRQVEALEAMNAVLEGPPALPLASTLLPRARPADLAPGAATPGERAGPAPVPVADFEVLEVLGRGGMGVVYKARQVSLNRLVALKMILAGPEARPIDLARFRTEALAVARLQHPNIVQIHDVGEHDGRSFVVLELVQGGNLGQHLDGRPQPPYRAARLVETLARAMHVVHQAGIIHRDLKPANVLLARSPGSGGREPPDSDPSSAEIVPKITDFGLAKCLDAGSGPTVTGHIVGSPSYMAPEQAVGQAVGPFTDTYALGAILYECLTGSPPFWGQTAWDTIWQVIHDEPTAPRRLQPGLSADLETICLKCLEKAPRKRYATALELAEDLRRFQAGEPVRAHPVGAWERLAKWARRRPTAAALLLVSLLALVALAGGGLVYHLRLRGALQQARDSAEQARQRLVRLHLSQGASYLDEGDWFAALLWFTEALSLDQGQPEREQMHRLRIASVLGQSPVLARVWFHNGPVRHACFSPDGKRVLACSEDATARVYELGSGQPVTPPLSHDGLVLHGAFSPDGQTVATAGQDGTVRLWAVATGRLRAAPCKHEAPVGWVAFSPDGRRLLSASQDGTARLWESATGKPVATWRHDGAVTHVAFSRDGAWAGTASADGTARVWDAHTGAAVLRLVGHQGPVLQVGFPPGGRRVLSASADGSARLWDAASGQPLLGSLQHRAAVVAAAFSPDGTRIVTASDDHTAHVWGSDSGALLVPLLRHRSGLNAASFGPKGRRVITASDDNMVRVWDALSGEPLTPLLRHAGSVNWAELSPDGRWALTASNDATVCLWDLAGTGQAAADAAPGQPRLAPPVPGRWRSPDGNWLVTAEGGHSAQVRDAEGRPIGPPLRHGSTVLFGTFSADGERVVTTSDDTTARIWLVRTGELLAQPLRHQGSVRQAAFSADGRLVVTADTRTARVWDAVTGEPITPALRFRGAVRQVAFAPDGTEMSVATTSGDKRVWGLRPDARPVADLLRLAQVLASGRVDPERGLLPLRPEELRDAWERTRPRTAAP